MTPFRLTMLMARREMNTRLLSKPFIISQIVSVSILVAVFALGSVFGDEDPLQLGIQGERASGTNEAIASIAELADETIEFTEVTSRADATAAVESNELDAVLIDGRELVMDQADATMVGIVAPALQQLSLAQNFVDAGLSAEEIERALNTVASVEITELDPDPEQDDRQQVAFVAVILLFVAIQTSGAYIMMGVFEEKSTKVVELVLASVKARYLLLGKILGIAVLGTIQVALMASAALISAQIFTETTVPGLNATLVLTSFGWFLLGYLLYGAVFAAGASLAPRQEDAQSTLAPIFLVLMLAYFGSIIAASEPEGLLSRILGWVPFTSPFAMPGRIAIGAASWWEIMASMAVTATAAVVVVGFAERIYVRSVIHTDRTLTWREGWNLEG